MVFPEQGRATMGHSRLPVLFPLNTPVDVTSAALTMGSARSKRAWLVATTCSVVAFIFVVIFKDDILPCRPPFAIVFLTLMLFFFFLNFPSPSSLTVV